MRKSPPCSPKIKPTMAKDALSPERQELLARLLEKRRAEARTTLSFAQERFWFLEQLQPGTAEYHITVVARARGKLRLDALRFALQRVALAHPALRTRFPAPDGKPRVELLPAAPHALDVRPAQAPQPNAIADLARAVHRLPFDLAAAPPWRVVVQALGPDEHALVFTFHHIITDGWSMGLFARDLARAYDAALDGAEAVLDAPTVTYQQLAHAERTELVGDKLAGLLDAWRAQLDGAPSTLELPTDRPLPPIADSAGATRRHTLAADTTAALVAFAARAHTTPYQLLLSLVGAFLARVGRTDDLVVGTSYAGRDRLGSTQVFGAFVNTLPVRLRPQPDAPLESILAHTQAALRTAIEAGRLPFEKLVSELAPDRDPRRTPLFNVFFELVVAHPIPAWRGVELTEVPVDLGTTPFDLTLAVDTRGARFPVLMQYRTALFDAATIDGLWSLFERFVDAWLRAPDVALDAVPWLAPATLQRSAALGRGPAGAAFVSNVERFAQQARATPDASAIQAATRTLTHGELLRAAAALAEQVGAALPDRASTRAVVVALPHSAEAVVAMLAAHLAGCAYVPLDLAAPPQRQAQIIAELADTAHVVLGPATFPVDLDALLRAQPALPHDLTFPSATDPAHILFTSGSTGRPKGVVVPQRALANHGAWLLATFDLAAHDRLLLRTPLGFDASLWELWAALLAGATLVVARGEDVLEFARAERITVLQTVPSLLRAWAQDPVWPTLADLRLVVVGGEALHTDVARAALAHASELALFNLYGPTEACIDTTFHGVTRATLGQGETVPIGRPLPATDVCVVDRAGQLVPQGLAGELWIAGAQLADGYHERPDETARAFVRAAPTGTPQRWYRTGDLVRQLADGGFEHLGRLDAQVQVHGSRVELGEVERALELCTDVRAAAVVAVERAGSAQLVGFVVLDPSTTPDATDAADALAPQPTERLANLHAELARALPRYMCPAPLIALKRLPLNASEKVDRRALTQQAQALQHQHQISGRAAQGPRERFLAETLARELDLDTVPVDVDFFQLGGHSLLATRLLAAARREFDVELSLRAFFEAPTLAALAHHIERASRATLIPRREPHEPVPLTRAQARLWLACAHSSAPAYNMPGALWLRGALDAQRLIAALDALIARHETLRAHFPIGPDGAPTQVFAAPDSIKVAHVQAERDAAAHADLRVRLQAEARHAFDLARGPLTRLTLVRYAPDLHALVLNLHHIIGDGLSIAVFARELSALYEGATLPPLEVRFGDFARFERAHELDTDALANWLADLQDAPALTAPLALPECPPATAPAHHVGHELYVAVPPELADALERHAAHTGTSRHNLWLASFAAFLARVTGETDLVLGAVVANRSLPALHDLIGFFVSALPLRLRLANIQSFDDLTRHVRERMHALHAATESPHAPGFDHIVEALQAQGALVHEPGALPLFQVGFDHATDADRVPTLADLQVSAAEFHSGTAKLDWNVRVEEGTAGARIAWEFRAARFDAAQIEALATAWLTSLASALQAPTASWRTTPLRDPHARQLALARGVGPASLAKGTALDALVQLAAAAPDTPALHMGALTVTRGALLATARAIGAGLAEHGAPGAPLAVQVPRSPAQVALLIGAWFAARPWLVLDADDPTNPDRLAAASIGHVVRPIAEQSDPATLWDTLAANPRALAGLEFVDVKLPAPATVQRADDAYLITTSGTTGTPKAIAIGHNALANQIASAHHTYALDADAVVLHRIPLSFDAALLELFAPLAAGATVVLADEVQARDPDACLDLIATRQVTLLVGVAAWIEALVCHPRWNSAATTVRTVIAGGEAPSAALLARLAELRASSALRAFNSYGPAETCVEVTAHAIAERQHAPIGHALPGCEVHVLDAAGEPTLPGVEGELVVGGAGLGRYLGAVDAERFRANHLGTPSAQLYFTGDRGRRDGHGALVFAGRLDRERKLGGRRFDLYAIERVVAGLPGVAQAAVVLAEGATLTAHIVRAPACPPVDTLLASARQQLPRGLCPTRWFAHAALPTFPSGKLDYPTLESSAAGTELHASIEAPQSDRERQLAALFAAQLGGAEVGRNTDFFEAGGHSLSAVRLVADVRAATGLALTLGDFFAHATPAALAAFFEAPIDAHAARAATWKRMQQDAALPADWACAPARTGGATLLTGATGFLGAFLLAELQRNAGDGLICLVRAADAAAGRERLRTNMERYGLTLAPHVEVLVGDLAAPRFGLATATWSALAARVGRVLHNGAAVDFFRSYAELHGPNVVGTLGALELALNAGAAFTLVSTIGVVALPAWRAGALYDEATPLAALGEQHEGYEQTKWVAEALVEAAAKRGLTAQIVRPGRIAASRAGMPPTDDFALRFWLGCLQLGVAPALAGTFDMVPVDDAARAIRAALPAQAAGALTTLHLVHRERVAFQEFAAAARRTGRELRTCPAADWLTLVRAQLASAPGSPALHPAVQRLAPLLAFLEAEGASAALDPDAALDHVDAARTHAQLQQLGAQPPAIDGAYLDALFARLARAL